jgi:omega-6 fatty acid desaturase (delta-12 desaturase)
MNVAAHKVPEAFQPSEPHIPSMKDQLKNLTKHCLSYKGADTRRSLYQLSTTMTLFFALSAAMIYGFNAGLWWITALLMLPTAGMLVRLFIIQHDCGHNSFFRTRKGNEYAGRLISLLTFTPHAFWTKAHNTHHANSGNLHKRGVGSIDTLTIAEYQALSSWNKFSYRLYRNPLFLLGFGTPFHILFIQRVPTGLAFSVIEDFRSTSFRESWRSILLLDIALAAFYGGLSYLVGWQAVLVCSVPVVVITAWVGGWLFFIQHQFEDGYWEYDDKWNFQEAAVLGSSYYALPRVMQWFTGNIGLHHIHHLCALVPNYKLQECLDNSPFLQNMNRMTFRDSLKCLKWALWDEAQKKMVSFRELKQIAA